MQFTIHTNYNIDDKNWGNAAIIDIIFVLESAIGNIETYLIKQNIPLSYITILHSTLHNPPINNPQFIKAPTGCFIYLDTIDTYWAQYSYQFAHEYCHFIMDCDYDPIHDKYGWIEESFAEFSSIFVLNEMSNSWAVNPPYPNWQGFESALKSYSDNKINEFAPLLLEPFKEWFSANENHLSTTRYDRNSNGIIAIEILNLFKTESELWKIIQFFKAVDNKHLLTFNELLNQWEAKLPQTIINKF